MSTPDVSYAGVLRLLESIQGHAERTLGATTIEKDRALDWICGQAKGAIAAMSTPRLNDAQLQTLLGAAREVVRFGDSPAVWAIRRLRSVLDGITTPPVASPSGVAAQEERRDCTAHGMWTCPLCRWDHGRPYEARISGTPAAHPPEACRYCREPIGPGMEHVPQANSIQRSCLVQPSGWPGLPRPAAHPPEGGTPRECPLPCVLPRGHEGLHRLALPVAAPPAARRRPALGDEVEVRTKPSGPWKLHEVVLLSSLALRVAGVAGWFFPEEAQNSRSWRWPEDGTKGKP